VEQRRTMELDRVEAEVLLADALRIARSLR
jgi:hypothetical protein